jgi:hypothetical protein
MAWPFLFPQRIGEHARLAWLSGVQQQHGEQGALAWPELDHGTVVARHRDWSQHLQEHCQVPP